MQKLTERTPKESASTGELHVASSSRPSLTQILMSKSTQPKLLSFRPTFSEINRRSSKIKTSLNGERVQASQRTFGHFQTFPVEQKIRSIRRSSCSFSLLLLLRVTGQALQPGRSASLFSSPDASCYSAGATNECEEHGNLIGMIGSASCWLWQRAWRSWASRRSACGKHETTQRLPAVPGVSLQRMLCF